MFARRVEKIEAAGFRRIFELAANVENLINLSIGQAHYDVPEPAKEAAAQAMRAGFNGYTATQGLAELNDMVVSYVKDRYGVESEAAFITSGGSGGLLLAFLTLLDRGDEVLLPDPYFISYYHLAHLCEAKISYYNLYPNFELNLEELEQKITSQTRAIVVNTPGNPTGGAFPEAQIKALCTLCRKHGVIILSDEIYADFSYDFPHVSPLKYYDNALLISGLSKTWGMAGWRIGYVLGPAKYLDRMKTLQQFTLVCAPAPLQRGAHKAMQRDMSAAISRYKSKRDLVYDGLKDKYDCIKPRGAFYIFPKVPEGFTDWQFVEAALARKVLLVPGSAFSTRTDHFRISFAADDETLQKGIEILRELETK
jgi:aspartate/methionine/tyrosine aminotransferase